MERNSGSEVYPAKYHRKILAELKKKNKRKEIDPFKQAKMEVFMSLNGGRKK